MITTHVLDTARGGAAVGVAVLLEIRQDERWAPVARDVTNDQGRAARLTTEPLSPGIYRMTFDISAYFRSQGIAQPFFPEAIVTFRVDAASEHYHVPLLVSPFGYTTYRGT